MRRITDASLRSWIRQSMGSGGSVFRPAWSMGRLIVLTYDGGCCTFPATERGLGVSDRSLRVYVQGLYVSHVVAWPRES